METPQPLWATCASARSLSQGKVFPDVQREPPVLQLVPIVPGPVTGHHWKEPGSVLFASSLQVFKNIDKTP